MPIETFAFPNYYAIVLAAGKDWVFLLVPMPIGDFCCQTWATCKNRTDLDEKRIFNFKLSKKMSEAHRNISVLKISLYNTNS